MTHHAVLEAADEGISADEIRETILGGMIVEDYPDERRGPCCLVSGKTTAGRDLHVVVTTVRSPVRIITVYEPLPPRWVTPTERGPR